MRSQIDETFYKLLPESALVCKTHLYGERNDGALKNLTTLLSFHVTPSTIKRLTGKKGKHLVNESIGHGCTSFPVRGQPRAANQPLKNVSFFLTLFNLGVFVIMLHIPDAC